MRDMGTGSVEPGTGGARLPRAGLLSSVLTKAGAAVLGLGVALAAAHCLAARSCLPRSSAGVGLLVVADFFLIPLGFFLLANGLVWRAREVRTPTAQLTAPVSQRQAVVAVLIAVLWISLTLLLGSIFFWNLAGWHTALVFLALLGVPAIGGRVVWGLLTALHVFGESSAWTVWHSALLAALVLGPPVMTAVLVPNYSLAVSCGSYLLILGVAIRFFASQSASATDASKRMDRHSAIITETVAVGVLLALAFASALVPVLSRRLEWGRYGCPPPVQLRDLSPLEHKLRLRFPPGTRVVRGEFISGPGEHAFAVLTMPQTSVQRFLHDQHTTAEPVRGDELDYWPSNLPPAIAMHLKGRSDLLLASLPRVGQTDLGEMALDLSDEQQARVYLYWEETNETTTW